MTEIYTKSGSQIVLDDTTLEDYAQIYFKSGSSETFAVWLQAELEKVVEVL